MAWWTLELGKSGLGEKRARHCPTARGYNHRVLRMRAKLRVTSNVGLILGQIILLFSSRDVGLIVIICSSLLSVPFFLKERMIDVLLLIAFMQIINVVGLFVR